MKCASETCATAATAADVERLGVGAIHGVAGAQQAAVEVLDLPAHRKRYVMKVNGAPDRIRTCDLRLRRPTLYPLSYRRQPRSDRLTAWPQAPGPDPGWHAQCKTPPRERNALDEEVTMYWGGGIIGLILLILLILLLTGNL